MDLSGSSIYHDGNWKSVQKTYIKSNNVWSPVKKTYVKEDGVWNPIVGAITPAFTTVSGFWGVDPRGY